MNISIGIVGLPNVGKSTLFNALTNLKIPAENYPFCTIEPNVGIVPVADNRLHKISEFVKTEKIIPAVIEFHDIAGLVKNAHKGEGLGNSFLANIRNTNIIVHILREFKSSDVTHVENSVDPNRDKEIVETELILKDIESVESKIKKVEKDLRFDKKIQKEFDYLSIILNHLSSGKLLSLLSQPEEEELIIFRRELFLITDKKFIYVINGDWETADSGTKDEFRKKLQIDPQFPIVLLNIKQEFELSALEPAEREEFMKELGIEYSGIDILTREAYKTLGLISFFTAGEMEIRAWTIPNGISIREAAGVIHTDFTNKFIAADIVSYDDFITNKGWEGSKKAGKARLEGRTYIVEDGDLVIIKHGA